MFQVRAIKSPEDYATALARVDALWDADEGTPEAEELDIVSTLIEAYEDRHFPSEVVSPIDAIRRTSNNYKRLGGMIGNGEVR